MKKFLSGFAGLLILLGIIVAVNILASSLRIRSDRTDEKLFTLSDGTKKLVGELDRPVTFKFYFSKSLEELPIPLKQYAQRVAELLKEYEAHGKGKLVLETYDPQPDSEEEEWAQRYGLTGQTIGFIGGPSIYFGIVAVSGTKEAAIPFLAPSAEPQLEYLLTRMVYEVTRAEKAKIGVLSTLPVMGEPKMPMQMQFNPREEPVEPWFFIKELKKQYDVVTVETSADKIPDDVQTLLVIHPKELSNKTLFAIDQFVLRGGRLLAFVDPLCVADQESSMEGGFQAMMGAASDLNTLTKAWGVELAAGQIVYDLPSASQVSSRDGGVDRMPTWLSLRETNLDRQEIATSSLETMLMPFAGGFTIDKSNAVQSATLIHSSSEAGLINSFEAMGRSGKPKNLANPGEQPLVVRLKGSFKTAFPNGAPPEPQKPGEDAQAEMAATTNGLKESTHDGVVVLVADADLLFDRFCVRTMGFLGQTISQPINDNLNFTLNMVEELAGSEVLIGLRSRGTYQRPFDKVLALEKQAQENWQAEESKLQEKLRDAQQRLNELQSTKEQDQKFILSPEQKKEIEAFRKQRFETQRQLKMVRKNLRHDIEALGLNLKIINIALVPCLVALFGISRGWYRRKKATSQR